MMVLLALPSACSTGQSTRMTGGDFQQMAEAMAQSLRGSRMLAQRRPASPPWVISIQKTRNLTSDVMRRSEQWAILRNLRSSLAIQRLSERKRLRFVIPARKTRMLRRSQGPDAFEEPIGRDRDPTHVMTATFRSLTRAQSEGRSDLYYAEFSIIDLSTGQVVWTDRFEFQRVARGQIWD